MKIINNTYFKGELYIPLAKPSITDNVFSDQGFNSFIYEYSRICLYKCLGPLFLEFEKQLDYNEDNLLKEDADEKWDHLLNGIDEYTDYKGNKKSYRGIRFKSLKDENYEYDRSFLANFVYFNFKKYNHIQSTVVGDVKPKAKSAEVYDVRSKAVSAYRSFYNLVQGDELNCNIINTINGLGLDWQVNDLYVSMYKFINDMNKINENTYVDFKPEKWKNINLFDL